MQKLAKKASFSKSRKLKKSEFIDYEAAFSGSSESGDYSTDSELNLNSDDGIESSCSEADTIESSVSSAPSLTVSSDDDDDEENTRADFSPADSQWQLDLSESTSQTKHTLKMSENSSNYQNSMDEYPSYSRRDKFPYSKEIENSRNIEDAQVFDTPNLDEQDKVQSDLVSRTKSMQIASRKETETVENLVLKQKNLQSLASLRGQKDVNKMKDIDNKWANYCQGFDLTEIGFKKLKGQSIPRFQNESDESSGNESDVSEIDCSEQEAEDEDVDGFKDIPCPHFRRTHDTKQYKDEYWYDTKAINDFLAFLLRPEFKDYRYTPQILDDFYQKKPISTDKLQHYPLSLPPRG